jgi:hypothetical protein
LAKHMVVQDSSEVFKHPKAWPMTLYKVHKVDATFDKLYINAMWNPTFVLSIWISLITTMTMPLIGSLMHALYYFSIPSNHVWT